LLPKLITIKNASMTNKDFFVATWKSEMQTTLNAIKGLPDDKTKWSYRCHEKTRTAADILGHMLPHAEVLSNSVDTGIADEHTKPHDFKSREDAFTYFEKWASSAADKINAMDEKDWDEKIIDFRVDGRTFYNLPMSKYSWMLIFDIVHHRGQLSTYYRLMGVRNPSIYGPTAEDIEEMMAKQN
jgi:uncharacterized damage-inducible protein DinB